VHANYNWNGFLTNVDQLHSFSRLHTAVFSHLRGFHVSSFYIIVASLLFSEAYGSILQSQNCMVLYYNRYFYTYRKENEQTLELRTKEFRNDRKTTYSHPNCKSDHTHPPHFHTHPPHHISQYTIISVFSLQCYRTPPATQKRRAIWPRPKFNIQILHSLAE